MFQATSIPYPILSSAITLPYSQKPALLVVDFSYTRHINDIPR